MLRKLFPRGDLGNNNSSSSSLTSKLSVNEEEECDARTGFAQSIAQLDQFETGLRQLLRTLTRHCQAISDICGSTTSFCDQLSKYAPQSSDAQTALMSSYKRQSDEAVGLVNMFRVSTIAPLQSLLIVVPQLRLRCEHRKSALHLMLRYQHKVSEMERSAKTRIESTRLQRNRAKLQAATARFRDLDSHVQREIRSLVTNDIAAIAGSPIRELLIRAQLLAGQIASESAMQLQSLTTQRTPDAKSSEQTEPQSSESSEEPQDSQQLQDSGTPTPQRRMAMTVLPHAEEEATMHVRQSILAPPSSSIATRASLSKQDVRRPSATATQNDDEDPEQDDEDDDDMEVLDMPERHEGFGIGKRKKHAHGSRRWDIHQHIKDSMAMGLDLVESVRLPEGFSRDEWIAVHAVDFFNEVNLLYGTVSEFCTTDNCPRMSAGPCYTYMWADTAASFDQQSSSPSPGHLPASQYVAKLMDWIETQINDPAIFPTDASTYREDFEAATASVILKRLFRVYAHMYHSHLEQFVELSAEMHLGFCFRRFVFFVKQFDLVEQRELSALRKLIQSVLDNPVSELVPEPGSLAPLS